MVNSLEGKEEKSREGLKDNKIKRVMKIIYLGKELNPLEEHELFSENEFGFEIDIKYTEGSWYPKKEQKVFNFTEFHWRYTDIFNETPSDGVAFESDIHRTGFTRKINVIERVEIRLAEKLYENFSLIQ